MIVFGIYNRDGERLCEYRVREKAVRRLWIFRSSSVTISGVSRPCAKEKSYRSSCEIGVFRVPDEKVRAKKREQAFLALLKDVGSSPEGRYVTVTVPYRTEINESRADTLRFSPKELMVFDEEKYGDDIWTVMGRVSPYAGK